MNHLKDTEVALRATNITPFDEDVKLFYTGDGSYSLSKLTTDKIIKKINTSPSNWGPSLQNIDGSIWVADGETFPFAFNAFSAVILKFVYGSTLYTATKITKPGQGIEEFLREINEEIADLVLAGEPSITTIEEARGLGSSSPVGIEMFYNGSSLVMQLVTSNNLAGNPGAFQTVTVAGFLSETSFSNAGGAEVFFQPNSQGYNIAIIIRDLQGGTYEEFINSLLNQDLYVNELRQYSRSTAQVNEPLQFVQYDVDGNIAQLIETNVVDPYQAQPTLDSYADIMIDGQTYCLVKILAGESLELRLIVDEAGIITYEELKSLDELLEQQGIEINKAECFKHMLQETTKWSY